MITHSGTITIIKDRAGNDKYLAKTELEPKELECWSLPGAAFWLWVIESRVQARIYRTGH